MLHKDKKKAIFQWFNCLTTSNAVESMTQLAIGNELLNIATSICERTGIHTDTTDSTEKKYDTIKSCINEFFQIKSESLISYSSCAKGNEFELAKVLIFLLSAVVQRLLSTEDSTLLTLTHLDNDVQEDIQECITCVLGDDRDALLKSNLNRILTRHAKCRESPRKNSINIASFTPPQNGGSLRSSSRLGRGRNLPISSHKATSSDISGSPLKTLLDSPFMMCQVNLRNKDMELFKVRRNLHVEENKCADALSELELVRKKVKNQDLEIKGLKRKVEELQETADDSNKYRELCEQSEQEIKNLRKKLEECRDLEQSNDAFNLENEALCITNKTFEDKLKNYDQLKKSYEDLQIKYEELNDHLKNEIQFKEKGLEDNKNLEVVIKELQEQDSINRQKIQDACDSIRKLQQSPDLPEEESLQPIIDIQIEEFKASLNEKDAAIAALEDRIAVKHKFNLYLFINVKTLQTQVNSLKKEVSTLNLKLKSKEEVLHSENEYEKHECDVEKSEKQRLSIETLQNLSEESLNIKSSVVDGTENYPNVSMTVDGKNLQLHSSEGKGGFEKVGSLWNRYEERKEIDSFSEPENFSSHAEPTTQLVAKDIAGISSEDQTYSVNKIDITLQSVFSNLKEKVSKLNEVLVKNALNEPVLTILLKIFLYGDCLRVYYERMVSFLGKTSNHKDLESLGTELNKLEEEAQVLYEEMKNLLEEMKDSTDDLKPNNEIVEQLPVNSENDDIIKLECDVENDKHDSQKLGDVSNNVVELQPKCDIMQKKCSDEIPKSEKEKLIRQIQKLQQENRNLKHPFKVQKQFLENLYKKIADAPTREQVENLNKVIETLSTEKEAYRTKYETEKKHAGKLRMEISRENDLIKMYSAQLKLCQNKIGLKKHGEKELKDALQKEKNRVDQLNSELNGLKNSMVPLETKIKELEVELKSKKKEINSLATQLHLTRNQIWENQQRIDNSNNQRIMNNSQLSTASASNHVFPNYQKPDHSEKIAMNNHGVNKISFATCIQFEEVKCEEVVKNTSFDSIQSTGYNNMSFLGSNNCFLYTDDEDGFLNHSSIADIKGGLPDSASQRLNELERRNTLCLPHLKSCYPVELQTLTEDVEDSSREQVPKTSTSAGSSRLRTVPMSKRNTTSSMENLSKKVKMSTVKAKDAVPPPTSYLFAPPSPSPRRFKMAFKTPTSIKRLINSHAVKKDKKATVERKTTMMSVRHKFNF